MQSWTQLKQLSSSSENGKERPLKIYPIIKTFPKRANIAIIKIFFIILRVNQRLVSTKNQLDKKSDWISERIANVWHCIYPRSTFGPKSEAALKNNRLYSWSLEGARMGQGVLFFFFFFPSEFHSQKKFIIWFFAIPWRYQSKVCRYLT